MIRSDIFGYLFNDNEPAFIIMDTGGHYYHLKTKRLFSFDQFNAFLIRKGQGFTNGELGIPSAVKAKNGEDMLRNAQEDQRPSAPSSPTVTPAGIKIMIISWVDESAGEAGFRIERSKEAESNFTIVGAVDTNITSFVDNSPLLEDGTLYEYNIRAFNIAGSSLAANASGTTDTP